MWIDAFSRTLRLFKARTYFLAYYDHHPLAMAFRCFIVLLATILLGFHCTIGSPLTSNNALNTTIIGPALSHDMFRRAVSAPYVFAVFTDSSESNLYIYTSSDATNFSLLKGPAYTPPTELVRDPSIMLHTE